MMSKAHDVPVPATAYDAAAAAVEAALAAGARYADARLVDRRTESMTARDGDVRTLDQSTTAGLGVRALVGSSWGFAALGDPDGDAACRATGARATAIARASAAVAGPDVDLVPAQAHVDTWASDCAEDPFAVSLAEKGDLLTGVTATMRAAGVAVAEALYQAWDTRTAFVSSEGARIGQHIRECGAGMHCITVGEDETQRRSYPAFRGQYGTRGFELVRELDLPAHAERIAAEATALLTAPPCPSGRTTLVLGGEQLSLQIHESVGHAVELDRILGWEAAYAGTSWLDLDRLGSLRYGSELMTITIDPTIPGALGSFGYDDEGTPAQRRYAVRDGIWVGVLGGRDSAAVAGLTDTGSVRADGYARMPMVRMTNVGFEPGPHSLEEIVAATDDGVLMEHNRSWSIDDRRLNFQFGCEIGYEIRDGRRGRMLRNPTYTGIGPQFWASLDMLAGGEEWRAWGTPNCGKGQPGQVGHTGHGAAPARFTDVRVGVRG
ncbi:TldD/PmbA family protein [Klenkia sp. PcliD-1-E]|uniref:TldD/PmbA family protein n=1 Tax=Klenkia sp. PcliD-1-E TaxID=2954492 RepID=UPI002098473B|nr:TldD/PmbA family protein [Klenkia sp. PcliD-1-E]MCO7219312.1 TldD/PmbA family protein [Klenkia sp. PcliD-1-E]